LKIVVCFKVTPDFEQVLPSDFENFSPYIDLNYVRRVISCFDEAALELALRIKDGRAAKNLPTECVALTYADALQSTFSRTLFAAGFDEIELIKRGDIKAAQSGEVNNAETIKRGDNRAAQSGEVNNGETMKSGDNRAVQSGEVNNGETIKRGDIRAVQSGEVNNDETIKGGDIQAVQSGEINNGETMKSGDIRAAQSGEINNGETIKRGADNSEKDFRFNNLSEFNSLNAAKNLAGRIKEISTDLVLTGKQGGYADSGTVPFYLAELLGLSVVSDSVFYENADGNACGIERRGENDCVFYENADGNAYNFERRGDSDCVFSKNADGNKTTDAERFFYDGFGGIIGKAVIRAGDMSVFGLRISPLKRLLAVSDKKIRVFQGVEYSINYGNTGIVEFSRQKNNGKCKITSNISLEIKDILRENAE
jgi:electron transfer flavoprotein alpha/beta subunit